MTDKVTAICAVVSAHNEQALIGRCIDSLTAAARHARTQRSDVHVRIIIAADACTDNTLSLVSSTPGIDALPCTPVPAKPPAQKESASASPHSGTTRTSTPGPPPNVRGPVEAYPGSC